MYQINKDVEQLLEAHGIKIKSRIDILTFKTVTFDCPKCNAKIRIAFDPEEVAVHVPGTGIANIVLDLPCQHVFVASIDRKLKIRSFMEIEQRIHATSERLDIRFLRTQEIALDSLHKQLVTEETNHSVQFKIFEELTRIRKIIRSIS